jgi:hypothetical protein
MLWLPPTHGPSAKSHGAIPLCATMLLLVNTTRVSSSPTTNTSEAISSRHQDPLFPNPSSKTDHRRQDASSTAGTQEGEFTSPTCVSNPNIQKYLEKRVLVQLNGSRKVMGILRGYDVCNSTLHRFYTQLTTRRSTSTLCSTRR